MKLVKLSSYDPTYINMDYITEVYASVDKKGNYYATVLDKHSYKISEETYNIILSYGKAG